MAGWVAWWGKLGCGSWDSQRDAGESEALAGRAAASSAKFTGRDAKGEAAESGTGVAGKLWTELSAEEQG